MSGSISLFILNMCKALQIKQKCDIQSNYSVSLRFMIIGLYLQKKYTYHFDVIQYWLLVKNTTRTVKWHRHCAASCDFAFLSLHGNSFHSNYMNQQAATHPFCVITDKLYTNELMWPCNNKIEGNFLPIIQQNVSEFSSAYKKLPKTFYSNIPAHLRIGWCLQMTILKISFRCTSLFNLSCFCPFTFFFSFLWSDYIYLTRFWSIGH